VTSDAPVIQASRRLTDGPVVDARASLRAAHGHDLPDAAT